jgi:hypothetical protein
MNVQNHSQSVWVPVTTATKVLTTETIVTVTPQKNQCLVFEIFTNSRQKSKLTSSNRVKNTFM